MVSQYGKEKGDRIYYSYVNRRGLDDTKPMKGQKGTKMKPTKREDIPTKWEDYISRTKKTKFGITKKEEHDCSAEHPDMSHNDYENKKLNKKAEEAAGAFIETVGGDKKFKPWYVNNRPFGPPRSPDQEKMAQTFTEAFKEVNAVWKEKETGKKAEEKEAKITAFLKSKIER